MNNHSVKVSVVIPAFNVAKYVRDSLQSIINQSLKDIEIIVVNDGSTDATLDIVEELAQLDQRIQVISIQNQGQSIARNIGLYKAIGEYIYFFDSDDLLEATALEVCYKKCIENDLDFLFFDADTFTDSIISPIQFDYKRTHKYQDIVFKGIDILHSQLDTNGYSASVCLALINRKFLYNHQLSFYPYIIHEDELFTFMMYMKANKVGLVNRVLFHRRIRSNSTMTSCYSMKNAMGCITVCRELKKYGSQVGLSTYERKMFVNRITQLTSITLYNVEHELPVVEKRLIWHIIFYEFFKYISIKSFIRYKFPLLFKFIGK